MHEYGDEGGLLSYEANVTDIFPVERATTIKLIVNRGTTAVLGLAIPSTILLRAE